MSALPPPPSPSSAVAFAFHHSHSFFIVEQVMLNGILHTIYALVCLALVVYSIVRCTRKLVAKTMDVIVRAKWNINRLHITYPFGATYLVNVRWFYALLNCKRLNSFSSYGCIAYLPTYYINWTNKSIFEHNFFAHKSTQHNHITMILISMLAEQRHSVVNEFHCTHRWMCWQIVNMKSSWCHIFHVKIQTKWICSICGAVNWV